jgi:hypothetical protein
VSSRFRFHREATAGIAASSQDLFAFLDDHRRLAAHMEKPSLMMAGAAMKITTDSQQGQAVGSWIRLEGRFLGIALSVEEVVSDYKTPCSENLGNPGRTTPAADRPVPDGF